MKVPMPKLEHEINRQRGAERLQKYAPRRSTPGGIMGSRGRGCGMEDASRFKAQVSQGQFSWQAAGRFRDLLEQVPTVGKDHLSDRYRTGKRHRNT